MGTVFINYRRHESPGEARALFNELVASLGKGSVFMDVDSIALGRDFRQVLQQRLASCDLMLALIGKGWVDAKSPSGRRCLDDPSDFVRMEIEAALKRNIPVTPVLVQGAQMPPAEQLPEAIRDFAYRNGFELSHNRWESDVQEMLKRLGLGKQPDPEAFREIDVLARKTPTESPITEARGGDAGAPVAPQSTSKHWLVIFGALAVAIAVAAGGLLYYHGTVAEEEARIEQLTAAKAEAAKARTEAEAAKVAAAAAQGERDRAAEAAKVAAAAAQGERDRAAEAAKVAAAGAQAARNRAAPAQLEPSGPQSTSRMSSGKDLFPPENFELLLKERIGQGKPDTPALRASIRQELNTRELLVREAQTQGYRYDPAVRGVTDPMARAQIGLAAQTAVVRIYVADWLKKNPISEADLRKEYNTIKSQIGSKEYKVRHIMVKTEGEARSVISALQQGRSFDELAKTRSKDPGSSNRGGDLDWNAPANFVKPFSDAMVKLPKGKFTTEPVQTQFGWHVIEVDDVREAKVPPFDEVKPQLQQRMQGQELDKYFTELRAKNGL